MGKADITKTVYPGEELTRSKSFVQEKRPGEEWEKNMILKKHIKFIYEIKKDLIKISFKWGGGEE